MISPRPPSSSPYARPPADVEHTQLRLRLLDGQAVEDQRLYVRRRVGEVRARAWGQPQRATCPLADLAAAVSVLYTQDPTVSHPAAVEGPGGRLVVADVVERLRLSGCWQVLAEAQRLTEALNETAVHVDVEDGAVVWRVVTPDLLEGVSLPGRPGEPGLLREWRPRTVAGVLQWCADEYDVRDVDRPVFRIVDADGADVTALTIGGDYTGDAYPWRYSPTPRYPLGRPFVPYSLRHADLAPRRLFSAWGRVETVDATLEAGAIDTMISHVCSQASFPTTYAVGCRLAAEQITLSDGRVVARAPVLDPAAIHELEATGEAGVQPRIDVIRNETDPLVLMDVSERIVARCATAWGLGPSDVQRTSADARSGIALAVSSEGRRRMQASRAPVYRPHDERLIGKMAALLNRAAVGGIVTRPESGWQVAYALSPLSPQERSQRQAEAQALYQLGAITLAELRAQILGETPAQAQAALAAVRDERTAAAAPARDLVREAAQDAVDALADGEDGLTVRALLAAVLDDQSNDVIEDDV
jgi:hypothetical protein